MEYFVSFRESEFLKKGYFGLTQELIYQWLGSWVTPYWWSDAHVNKALASFLASNAVIDVSRNDFIMLSNLPENGRTNSIFIKHVTSLTPLSLPRSTKELNSMVNIP